MSATGIFILPHDRTRRSTCQCPRPCPRHHRYVRPCEPRRPNYPSSLVRPVPSAVCPDIAGYNAVYDSDATTGVSLTNFNTVYGWTGAASACSSRTACLGFNTAGALFTSATVQASVGSCFYVKIQGGETA